MYVPNAYAEGPASIGAAQDVVLNPITDKKFHPQEIQQCIQKDSAPLVNLFSSQKFKGVVGTQQAESHSHPPIQVSFKTSKPPITDLQRPCFSLITSHLTQNVRQISDYKGGF